MRSLDWRSLSALSLLASVLAACGGQTSDAGQHGPQSTHASAVLVGAHRGDALYVVDVDASTGDVHAFPALPANASTERFSALWANADRSRIVVELDDTDPSSWHGRVIAGDGTKWWVLDGDAGGGYYDMVSSQLSYVYARHRHEDDTMQPEIVAFDGTHVWGVPARAPSGDVAQWVAWAPDESGFALVPADGSLAWRTMNGTQTTLRDGSTTDAAGGILHAWSTSLLLFGDAYPKLSWIDTNGATLAVDGFTPDQSHVSWTYVDDAVWYRADGTLYRLRDRGVDRVGPIADTVELSNVLASSATGTYVWSDDVTLTATTNAGSTLATLTPKTAFTPTTADATGLVPSMDVSDVKMQGDVGAVFLTTSYSRATSPDSSEEVEFDEILWSFGADGATKATRVAALDPSSLTPGHVIDGTRLSNDARSLLRVTPDGVLTIFDAASGAPRTVTSDYAFDTTLER